MGCQKYLLFVELLRKLSKLLFHLSLWIPISKVYHRYMALKRHNMLSTLAVQLEVLFLTIYVQHPMPLLSQHIFYTN